MYLICVKKYKRHKMFNRGATDHQQGLGRVEREQNRTPGN